MKKSYYAIIPADVRYDERLSMGSRLLYGEITALTSSTGECWATNNYFTDLYNVKKNTISRWITELQDCGYINLKANGTKRVIYITKNGDTPHEKSGGTITKNGEDIKENTTVNNTLNSVAQAQVPKTVDWSNTKSDYQRLIAFYIERYMPDLYKSANSAQVTEFYKMYGRMFSSFIKTAGSLEVAKNAIIEAEKYFGKYQWGLKALQNGWAEFVAQALSKGDRQ